MREIKFRAWDKVHGRMLQEGDNGLNPYAMTFDGKIVQAADTDLVFADGAMEFLELMQYTGLKDKTGKDIYEGDILQYHVMGEAFGKFKVKWNKHGFWDCGMGVENSLVIGNIYENPEKLDK